jgi:hypothetical protein
MAAAVVKLDALANAVWPTTQNENLRSTQTNLQCRAQMWCPTLFAQAVLIIRQLYSRGNPMAPAHKIKIENPKPAAQRIGSAQRNILRQETIMAPTVAN